MSKPILQNIIDSLTSLYGYALDEAKDEVMNTFGAKSFYEGKATGLQMAIKQIQSVMRECK